MNNSEIKILIVDDEPDIRELLSYNLTKEGYQTYQAKNGREAIDSIGQLSPDLVILDIMMPEMDGIETCRVIRSNPKYNDIRIIFLTAKGGDGSQIEGLEVGADDYISKPLKIQIFISRVKAILRRYKNINDSTCIKVKDLVIDIEKYEVTQREEKRYLPKKEFELLALLASKPGKVFKREEIYNTVWGPDVIVTDRTIDVHIRKLREKLGSTYIKTVKGIGYKFDE